MKTYGEIRKWQLSAKMVKDTGISQRRKYNPLIYEKVVNLINPGNENQKLQWTFKTSMLANFNTFERTKCEGGCCRPTETSGGSVNWHLFLREINLPCLRNHFDIVEISPSYSTFKVHSIGNPYPCGRRNRSKGVHSNNVPNSTKLQTTPRFIHREWINAHTVDYHTAG